MIYVVSSIWKAKAGQEEKVSQALENMARLVRNEPGCLLYFIHRSIKDKGIFLLYEQFIDMGAFETHQTTDYYRKYIVKEAWPNLESREPGFYEVINPS